MQEVFESNKLESSKEGSWRRNCTKVSVVKLPFLHPPERVKGFWVVDPTFDRRYGIIRDLLHSSTLSLVRSWTTVTIHAIRIVERTEANGKVVQSIEYRATTQAEVPLKNVIYEFKEFGNDEVELATTANITPTVQVPAWMVSMSFFV